MKYDAERKAADPGPPPRPAFRLGLKKFAASREMGLFLVLVVLAVLIQLRNPAFLTGKNIGNMFVNYSVTMILALGMMGVLLVGGIDISIGSTIALAGMSSGLVMRGNPRIGVLAAFLLSIGIGLLCGLLIGLVIVNGQVPPIICTMGFMNVYRGMTYLIAENQWVAAYQIPSEFKRFATGSSLSFGLLNNMITVMLVCYLLYYFFMRYARPGRRIYATGSHEEAARVSGINTGRIKISVYALMGFLSGLAGAMWVSVYASAQGDMAMGIEMDVIAACVIGGVSLNGGRGTVIGVFLGALTMAILGNALPLVGVSQFFQTALKGIVILLAVILNVLGQRSLARNNRKRREIA